MWSSKTWSTKAYCHLKARRLCTWGLSRQRKTLSLTLSHPTLSGRLYTQLPNMCIKEKLYRTDEMLAKWLLSICSNVVTQKALQHSWQACALILGQSHLKTTLFRLFWKKACTLGAEKSEHSHEATKHGE